MLKTIWGKSILIVVLVSAIFLPLLFILLPSSKETGIEPPLVEDLDSSINGGRWSLMEDYETRIYDFRITKESYLKSITAKFFYSYFSIDESITNFLYYSVTNKDTREKIINNKFIGSLTISKTDYFYIDHFERNSNYIIELKLVSPNKKFQTQFLYTEHIVDNSDWSPFWFNATSDGAFSIATNNSIYWEFGYVVHSARANITQQLFIGHNSHKNPDGTWKQEGWSLYGAIVETKDLGYSVYIDDLQPDTEYFIALKAIYPSTAWGVLPIYNTLAFKTLP